MENKYKIFFDEIKKLIEKRKKRGFNNYNLLRTVLQPNDEVRLHSRIIYSLLNINGEHYQNTLFLELFLDVIGIEDYCVDNSKIVKEYKYIDLYLTDGKKHIIIENKINADDQPLQIQRYIEKIKHNNLSYKNLYVIYLSKNREQPSQKSLGNYTIKDNIIYNNNEKIAIFLSINYNYHIKRWIEFAIKEVDNITNLSVSLKQYKDIIDMINNEYKDKIMDLTKIIIKNQDNFEIAQRIAQDFEKIKEEFKKQKIEEIVYKLNNFKRDKEDSDGIVYIYEKEILGVKFKFRLQMSNDFYYGFATENENYNKKIEQILKDINNWENTEKPKYWISRKTVTIEELIDKDITDKIIDDIENVLKEVENELKS